jgi:hypothetical protein
MAARGSGLCAEAESVGVLAGQSFQIFIFDRELRQVVRRNLPSLMARISEGWTDSK